MTPNSIHFDIDGFPPGVLPLLAFYLNAKIASEPSRLARTWIAAMAEAAAVRRIQQWLYHAD
jgi:hypothetical protein